VGLSHTIIDGNFISFTHNGVAISDYARKTILTNNQFQEVGREILDWGARTIGRSNKAVTVAEEGEITAGLDDLNGQRELAAIRRPAFPSLSSSAAGLRLTPDVHDLHTLVSQLAYASAAPKSGLTDVDRSCPVDRDLFRYGPMEWTLF
jgi:hypothetical protein